MTGPQGTPPAYSAGYLAGRADAPLSDNPHPHTPTTPADCPDWQQWRRGWLKAEQDIDAENVERQFREPR